DTARGFASQFRMSDDDRRTCHHQGKIGELFAEQAFRFRFAARVSDQVFGTLAGIVIFVDDGSGRGSANRSGAGINKSFKIPAAHGGGEGEGSFDVGLANPAAVAEGGTGR